MKLAGIILFIAFAVWLVIAAGYYFWRETRFVLEDPDEDPQ